MIFRKFILDNIYIYDCAQHETKRLGGLSPKSKMATTCIINMWKLHITFYFLFPDPFCFWNNGFWHTQVTSKKLAS